MQSGNATATALRKAIRLMILLRSTFVSVRQNADHALSDLSLIKHIHSMLFLVSNQRAMPGGRVEPGVLPKGPNGRCLCRWCNLEVPHGRLTFCSEWCVEQWKLRSSPAFLRERVFQRDRGICAACGLDCVAEYVHIRRLRGSAKAKAILSWQLHGRKSLWDADHILPVCEGGGECD